MSSSKKGMILCQSTCKHGLHVRSKVHRLGPDSGRGCLQDGWGLIRRSLDGWYPCKSTKRASNKQQELKQRRIICSCLVNGSTVFKHGRVGVWFDHSAKWVVHCHGSEKSVCEVSQVRTNIGRKRTGLESDGRETWKNRV